MTFPDAVKLLKLLCRKEPGRVALHGVDGHLRIDIMAYTATVRVSVAVACEPGELGIVEAQDLLRMAVKPTTVDAEGEGGDRVVVLRGGGASIRLGQAPGAATGYEPVEATGVLDAAALATALGRVLPSCVGDGDRYGLECVEFARRTVAGTSAYRVAGTDGNRIHSAALEADGCPDFVLPRRAAEILARLAHERPVGVGVRKLGKRDSEGGLVSFYGDGWEVHARLAEVDFPDWPQVVPREDQAMIRACFGREAFLPALACVAKVNATCARLSFAERRMVLAAEADGAGEAGAECPAWVEVAQEALLVEGTRHLRQAWIEEQLAQIPGRTGLDEARVHDAAKARTFDADEARAAGEARVTMDTICLGISPGYLRELLGALDEDTVELTFTGDVTRRENGLRGPIVCTEPGFLALVMPMRLD